MRALFLIAAFAAFPALADLYRWIDPESGSVKFSSVPPPWYGDAERERRAPPVEVIRDKARAPARPAAELERPDPEGSKRRQAEEEAMVLEKLKQ